MEILNLFEHASKVIEYYWNKYQDKEGMPVQDDMYMTFERED